MLPLLLAGLAAAAPTHDIVPADTFTLDEVHGIAVDHTGSKAVFVRARWDDGLDVRKEDLWLLDPRSRATSRLTFGTADAHKPCFSADDAWVYYLTADEAGKAQLHRVNVSTQADQQVTRLAGGIDDYALGADGVSLWYLTHEDAPVQDAWTQLRARLDKVTYADRTTTQSTVHKLDLRTWRTQEAWSPGAYVVDFAASPDGARLAAILAPDDALISHEGGTRVLIHNTDGQVDIPVPDTLWRANAKSPYGWMLGLAWSPDSRALAFRVDWDGYPGEAYVAELAGDEPLVWAVPRPHEVSPQGNALEWVPVFSKRELCYRGADSARTRIVCVGSIRAGGTGDVRVFPSGDVVVDAFAFSGDGRDILALVGTPDRFPDLYRLPARGNLLLPSQITTLNPQVADWKLPHLQAVSWTAPDGKKVEGILETPFGWDISQGPLPTVVHIHGGPTAHEPLRRVFTAGGRTLFSSQGWAVFSANYRGSTSYGDAFLTDLLGRENEVEVSDILSGVDMLVEKGIADKDKLAVMGWSNGGFLVNALVTKTDRFKAASSGAGVADQTMQWATEDTPHHVVNLVGLPWTKPESTIAASPIYALGAVKTPLLLHVGENDERVPSVHAQAMFRGLDVYLDVPTELVIYPGAGHGLVKRSQRLTKMSWDLAWFDKWVLGKEPTP
jgi:dipeptidyl aminopeptidase/acylaminoacyl peptidase